MGSRGFISKFSILITNMTAIFPFGYPTHPCPCCFSKETWLCGDDEDEGYFPSTLCLNCGYSWNQRLSVDELDIFLYGEFKGFRLPSGDQPSLLIE